MPKSARKPARTAAARPRFTPVATRARHDGWTPERQVAFVEALAASGCVEEACGAVGLSKQSAYALRMRTDAQGFRVAWDAALDLGVRRLSDACFSRALNGEVIPHFYQGEQVGEHRRYDNRLAMFLLRYRDPLRYAATLDQMVYAGHPEAAAIAFAKARDRVADEAWGVAERVDPAAAPWTATPVAHERTRQHAAAADAAKAAAADAAREQARRDRDGEAELQALMARLDERASGPAPATSAAQPPARRRGRLMGGTALAAAASREGRPLGDVPSSSSTSAPGSAAPGPSLGAPASADAAVSEAYRRQQPRISSV